MTDERGAKYRERFNTVCNHLMVTAYKLQKGLTPVDVTGAYFASGIEFFRQYTTDEEVVQWLRELADGLEKGEVGLTPRRTH